MPTYRTTEHRTDRILKDWILKERLAFNLESSWTVSELQAILPPGCKQQLGELKPTDNTFRKMSSGFNKVSDVWIELMRFVGVQDFSPEQAILGTVSTFLDSENVRVKLNASYDAPHRKNSIEVLCLNEPSYQGLIRYEGNRLSFPPSIFEAVIDRRLSVYGLYCENLSDLLLIPGVSDPHSLLIAENNARLAEENRGLNEQAEPNKLDRVSAEILLSAEEHRRLDEQPELKKLDGISDEDVWLDSNDTELAELEAARDERDHNQLMGSLLEEETSDDAIALTPFEAAEVETDPDVQDQILAKAIHVLTEATDDFVDDHGNSIYDAAVNDPETTPFDSAVNSEIYHKISFDERLAKNAARTAKSEIKNETSDAFDEVETDPDVQDQMLREAIQDSINGHGNSIDDDTNDAETEVEAIEYTDADAEIETAVDGHGSESGEVDKKIEKFDEDWDGTWPQSPTDEVDDEEANDNDLYPEIVVGAADIRDYDLDDEF